MKVLTTRELAQELAGGDYFIRTANNVVKGLAIPLRQRSVVKSKETGQTVAIKLRMRRTKV